MRWSAIKKGLILALGWVFVVLGLVGLFLPLLPTTPFLLVATVCFYHSSPRFHRWLLEHPRLGPPLQDWQQRGAISRKTKLVALSLIFFSAVLMWIVIPLLPIKFGVSLLLSAVSVFILTRPH